MSAKDLTEPSPVLLDPARLASLYATDLLDSPVEEKFERLTALACRLLQVPVALISLVDDHRQFFKSSQGLPEPWATQRETPLSHSFCQYVVREQEPLIICDAREVPLVCENEAIQDLGVIGYLGIPLLTPEGHAIGSLCAIDHQPRDWTPEEIETLSDLAALLTEEIALFYHLRQLHTSTEALRQQTDTLRQDNQRMRSFTQMAAHDLSSPLQSFMIFSEILMEEYGTHFDAKGRSILSRIIESARQMSTLLKDLLSYIGSERAAYEMREVNLTDLVRRVLDILEKQIVDSAATIHLDALPSVWGSTSYLQLLLQNLIGNALKYRRAGTAPVVWIRAVPEPGAWRIEVQDNGIGLAAEDLETIFEPFVRVAGKAYPGTGIGLATCKHVVENHGGQLGVVSTPGEGSTFAFSLPHRQEAASAPAGPSGKTA